MAQRVSLKSISVLAFKNQSVRLAPPSYLVAGSRAALSSSMARRMMLPGNTPGIRSSNPALTTNRIPSTIAVLTGTSKPANQLASLGCHHTAILQSCPPRRTISDCRSRSSSGMRRPDTSSAIGPMIGTAYSMFVHALAPMLLTARTWNPYR